MSGEFIEMEGTVTRTHRGDAYECACEIGALRRTVLCKRGGRLNQHHIRLTVGDRVRVEVSPYDTTRGRITRRL
jgi:translation initiation factor IF-1